MIYTPEIIAYIRSHWNVDMRGADIAAAIGVSYTALKKQIGKLRDRGVKFAEKQYNKPAEIGEVREVKCQGRISTKIKNESGEWVYVKSVMVDRKPRKKAAKAKRRPKFRLPANASDPDLIPFKKRPKTIEKGSVIGRELNNNQSKKPQPMPTRKQRKVADKPQPIKRTGMSDEEKLAAGFVRVKLDNRTWVLRHPDKIKTA